MALMLSGFGASCASQLKQPHEYGIYLSTLGSSSNLKNSILYLQGRNNILASRRTQIFSSFGKDISKWPDSVTIQVVCPLTRFYCHEDTKIYPAERTDTKITQSLSAIFVPWCLCGKSFLTLLNSYFSFPSKSFRIKVHEDTFTCPGIAMPVL